MRAVERETDGLRRFGYLVPILCETKCVLDAEMLQNGKMPDARWCGKIQDARCNMQHAAKAPSTRLKNSADTHRRTRRGGHAQSDPLMAYKDKDL